MSIDALKRYRANVISEYQYYGDRQRDLEVKRAAYIKMMDAKIEECTTSMVELGKVIDTIDEFLNDEHPVDAALYGQ